MFKEIETELLSIISDDPIEKIAHIPTKEIAKTMELLYKIKFEDIQRVYSEKINNITRITVIYDAKDNKSVIQDLCPINGRIYYITFFPSSLLNKDENNAISLSKAIIIYVSSRLSLLIDEYENIIKKIEDNILDNTMLQAVPIITCAIIRKIYSGPALSKIIYNSLIESMPIYKTLYTEEGITTVLDLFDEGLGVSELLDSGFICSIPANDPKYPGIWCNKKKEE